MIKIRKVETSDLNKLISLFDKYRVFYKKESDIKGAELFVSERLKQLDSIFFVAENSENELTGFVHLYPLFSSTRMKRLWLLNDLYVEESQRGKGISVKLIDAAKKLCIETDACGLMLETAKSNTIGNSLYPRAGFELDDEHNYYSWDV